MYYHVQDAARNTDGKGVSDGEEEQVTRHWTKGDLGYKTAENMFELCSTIERKVELVSKEICFFFFFFLGRGLSSMEGVAWLLFTAYRKLWEER